MVNREKVVVRGACTVLGYEGPSLVSFPSSSLPRLLGGTRLAVAALFVEHRGVDLHVTFRST